jgi:hypothetical protein
MINNGVRLSPTIACRKEIMKKNETSNQKELESVNNSKLFGSFDPADASWIIGGRLKITQLVTCLPNGSFDVENDIIVEL